MRTSCNGCRVLRQGCGEHCSIRSCLQWIPSPESQANATVFLSKFYGRAGLINLITAGPEHQRPAIFMSLLYEACGRIVDPINGSSGLLSSGRWQLCHAAVEAVLNGKPIAPTAADAPTQEINSVVRPAANRPIIFMDTSPAGSRRPEPIEISMSSSTMEGSSHVTQAESSSVADKGGVGLKQTLGSDRAAGSHDSLLALRLGLPDVRVYP